MRINQYVAAASDLSRRGADLAVAAGRVALAGQPAKAGQQVAPGEVVTLDGRPLQPPTKHTYVTLHKPAGYVSSHAHQGEHPTLYELLPPGWRRLRLAGRLDRESSGLVLLSSDGPFIQRLSHPSNGKQKLYELTLARSLTAADAARLEQGVGLTDGLSVVEVIKTQGRQTTVALTQGRNRQLRRTFGALGYNIERLHRISLGPYQLGELEPGAWREVRP